MAGKLKLGRSYLITTVEFDTNPDWIYHQVPRHSDIYNQEGIITPFFLHSIEKSFRLTSCSNTRATDFIEGSWNDVCWAKAGFHSYPDARSFGDHCTLLNLLNFDSELWYCWNYFLYNANTYSRMTVEWQRINVFSLCEIIRVCSVYEGLWSEK